MAELHDINRLPEDGYLVLPISTARIEKGQSPEVCIDILKFFENKVTRFGLDVVVLYTDGFYFNAEESSTKLRQRMSEKVASHKNKLEGIITKGRRYMPQAFHYLPWDYALLNSLNFKDCFNQLRQQYKRDTGLRTCVASDLGSRPVTSANIDFILEEVVVSHLIRQKLITLPRTLVKEDNFRCLVYPGKHLETDHYQYTHALLPTNRKAGKRCYPYAAGVYDFSAKVFCDFRTMN